MSTTAEHFLTVDELATYLRVSRSMAYKLVWERKVPCVRVGASWRIPRAELDRRLAEDASPEKREPDLRRAQDSRNGSNDGKPTAT